MAKRHTPAEPAVPALYATVQTGLEEVAADEITRDLGGDIRRIARGLVVFRIPEITDAVLQLRTVEDVFLLAWGTDKLTRRAADLKQITHWTARDADWPTLLKVHHAIRPKPKGKPSFWIVSQMSGRHVYRRVDVREALERGLVGHIPDSWRAEEENASVEVWITIQDTQAVCGLRLSDRTMRHRTYKFEHRPASLRPSVAAAMVRLAGVGPGMTVVDPMCGAGTLLAEQIDLARRRKAGFVTILGGDIDKSAVQASAVNLRRLGSPLLARWDARRLPLAEAGVDRVISNPPFGVQLGEPEELGPLYQAMVAEYDRVLRSGGRAVLLVADLAPLTAAVRPVGWRPLKQLRLRILGQPAVVTVWKKPDAAEA
jgi:tRNA (guanine6-N2)-methyltransferase